MNIRTSRCRSALAATIALAAMVAAPTTASALSITITGDDGNPVAVNPGTGPTIRYLTPTATFTPAGNERYGYDILGPNGQAVSASSGSCLNAGSTRQVNYGGNGVYTIRVSRYAAGTGSCGAVQGTTDYPFITNASVGLSGPPKAVLTRNPGKLFRNTLTLPVSLVPGAISNHLFYGHNSAVNPDNSLAAPAGQVYGSASTGTVDVPLDKGPGTYQLAGRAEGFNTPDDVFTPWSPVVQWQAFAPFDIKKLSFPDSKGPSYRIRATFNETSVTGRVSIAYARGTKGGKYHSLGSVKVSKHSVTKRFTLRRTGTYRLRFKYKGNALVAGGYEVDKIRITRRITFRSASRAASSVHGSDIGG